jgi:coenzyme F420 biosynthesis associated uncharacterized protein
LSDGGIVDWRLAERVGLALAGAPATGEGGVGGRPFGPAPVAAACAAGAEWVAAYTGLDAAAVPAGEAIGRPEWVRSALGSLRELAVRIEDRLGSGLAGPLGSVARALAGAAAGAEAGAAVGLASRRVLGQFDVSLGEASRPPRLLLLEPNLAVASAELGGEPEAFLSWIAIHEVTHAVQFAAAPWLRDHLRSELDGVLDAAARRLDAAELRALARRLVTTDPRRTVRALFRGELATALAGPEQAERLDGLQATMAAIEGYAEHVMDAAEESRRSERLLLRRRLEQRRRSRGGLAEVVARLLGLELKLRQYRQGKAFCDAVVDGAGIEAANRLWASPEALPAPAELAEPRRWIERTA